MKLGLSITWYPWQATVQGPARKDEFVNMFREVEAPFERLPGVGETFYFEDGGVAQVEAILWRLDGMPTLFLGRRYEKKGEAKELWLGRGFQPREPDLPGEPTKEIEPGSV